VHVDLLPPEAITRHDATHWDAAGKRAIAWS